MNKLFPYAGSSSKYAKVIAEMIRREEWETYAEPMIGSGAVFFELCPIKAYINDINPLTANLYMRIKDNPEGVINALQEIAPVREQFESLQHSIHGIDNDVSRAASWYYLLWLCYNGVVKEREGLPYLTWGDRYIRWPDRLPGRFQHIRVASHILAGSDVYCGDYALVPVADIAFFDPPWHGSAEDYGVNFDHPRLAEYLRTYHGRWILTVNKHEFTERIYGPISLWEKTLNPYYSVAPTTGGRFRREERLFTNFIPRMFGG